MNSRVIAAVAAAVLAVLGIGATVVYAAGANDRAFDGATMTSVYQVVADVPADTDAASLGDAVAVVKLPTKAIAKGAVTNLQDLEGLKTTIPLVAGEQLLASRFDKAGAAGASGGSGVPDGLQQVSVSLPTDAAGGPAVVAGTRVGVLATVAPGEDEAPVTRMFAQDVLVTDLMAAGDGGVVTLAVNGELATQITAVVSQGGTIRLTAQNANTKRDGGKPVRAGTLVK